MTLYRDKYRIESSRLSGWDYRLRGWYFVTICAFNRASIFGEIIEGYVRLTRIGQVAESDLQTLADHYNNVEIDAHVVMPNHVHAIVMIDGGHGFSPRVKTNLDSPLRTFASPTAGSLSAIIRSYKAGVTLKCRDLGFSQSIWQARFHDHLLRGDKVTNAVREYIRNNPANWKDDKENYP